MPEERTFYVYEYLGREIPERLRMRPSSENNDYYTKLNEAGMITEIENYNYYIRSCGKTIEYEYDIYGNWTRMIVSVEGEKLQKQNARFIITNNIK